MKIRIGLLVLTAALVFALAAPAAEAGCIPAKQFGQISAIYTYTYFSADANVDPAAMMARFWTPGQRSTNNEGPCTAAGWWTPFGAPGQGYMNGFMGSPECNNAGCPNGSLLALLQAPSGTGAEFVAAQVAETPAQGTVFDFTVHGAINSGTIPRPTVIASSRAGTNVNLTLRVNAPASGFYGNVGTTGYQIVRFAGTADPGRNAANWTLVQDATPGADNAIVADCTNTAVDQFYATRMTFNGGEFPSDFVSASVRANCNPQLADPRFKLIDKKPAGKKEISNQ